MIVVGGILDAYVTRLGSFLWPERAEIGSRSPCSAQEHLPLDLESTLRATNLPSLGLQPGHPEDSVDEDPAPRAGIIVAEIEWDSRRGEVGEFSGPGEPYCCQNCCVMVTHRAG
jgi:hypothetical protein